MAKDGHGFIDVSSDAITVVGNVDSAWIVSVEEVIVVILFFLPLGECEEDGEGHGTEHEE